MRPTHSVVWVVSAADSDLVAAVRGCDGSDPALALVARALIAARPEVAAAIPTGDPRAVLLAALDAATPIVDGIVAAGQAAAGAAGVTLSSVSGAAADRRILLEEGGTIPGLLILVHEWDPTVPEPAGVARRVLPTADLEVIRAERIARVPLVVEDSLTARGFVWAGIRHDLAPDARTYWLAAATAELTYPQPPVVGLDGQVAVFASADEIRPAAQAAIDRVQALRAAAAWTAAAIAQATTPAEMDAALSDLASA